MEGIETFHLYQRCPFLDKQLDHLNEAYGPS